MTQSEKRRGVGESRGGGEKWWPVEWTKPNEKVAVETSLTRFHPTVKRAMRDKIGVVLEFDARLGRPNLDLGRVGDLELRCILLDLAARWMRNEDDGEANNE